MPTGVPVRVELCWFFAGCEDGAGVFVFRVAAKRSELHPFVIGGKDVDPANRARPEAKVPCFPQNGFFLLSGIFHFRWGGAHVDP